MVSRMRFGGWGLAALVLGVFAWPRPVQASLMFQVPTLSITPGASGSFDVVLLDTDTQGTPGYQVAAFTLGLSVPNNSGVSFTSAGINTSTAYLFVDSGTLNVGGPLSLDAFPTVAFTASDSEFSPPGYRLISPGDQFGVAHVEYAADPSAAAGLLTPTVVPDNTSLSDPSGNVPTPIPEPSAIACFIACCATLLISRNRAARR